MPPFLVAAVAVSGIAAWTDFRTGEIPNWLTFGTLCIAPPAYVVTALLHKTGWQEALTAYGGASLAGIFFCGLVPMFLYSRGSIGGGDVKLFAALGALCRPMVGVETEMYCFCFAALLAPARLAYEGKLFQTFKNAAVLMVNPFLPAERKRTVEREMMTWFRLGPAIFLGTVLSAALNWRML